MVGTSCVVYITCGKSADASGLSWGIIQCCCLPNVDKGGGKILVLTVDFRECRCKLDWACVCGDMCLKRVSSRECSPNNIASGCFPLGILMKWVSPKGCGLNDGVSWCLVLSGSSQSVKMRSK